MKRRNIEGLTHCLIQHAARSAPPSLAERLEEEWLADLEARTGTLARLRFGVGCCWATRVIAHEHAEAAVLATGAAAGSKVMAAHVQHDDPFFSRRTLTFLLIVGLHGMIIYALATGLGHSVIAVMAPTPIGRVIEPPKQTLPPPQTTQPTLVRPRVDDFKAPEIDLDPGVATGGLPVISDPLPPQPPAAPEKPVNRMMGGPGRGFPNTENFYPPAEIRNNHTGAVIVRTCVDENGRLTAAPTIAESSGFENLDAGALSLAKAGSGHYRPTTEDGVPVSSCYQVHIRFQLTNLGR